MQSSSWIVFINPCRYLSAYMISIFSSISITDVHSISAFLLFTAALMASSTMRLTWAELVYTPIKILASDITVRMIYSQSSRVAHLPQCKLIYPTSAQTAASCLLTPLPPAPPVVPLSSKSELLMALLHCWNGVVLTTALLRQIDINLSKVSIKAVSEERWEIPKIPIWSSIILQTRRERPWI